MWRSGIQAFVVGLCVLTAPWSSLLISDDATSSAEKIQLTECRIKLIDQVTLASDRPGVLRFVESKEGDPVRAKQKVAGLQDELIQAELAAAEHKAKNDIEVRANKKAKELADTEYDRAKQANRDVKNTVPLIELHRLKLAAEKSVLEIELAEHDLVFSRLQRDLKQAELETYAILAPFDGVVTKVYKRRGEAVRQGDPILELTKTDLMKVEGWVDLDYAWRISVGNPVSVRLSVPDADLPIESLVFDGRITFVDVSVQPVTRQTKVFAEIVNQENILRAGLTAEMTVQLDSKEKQALSAHSDPTRRRPRTNLEPTNQFQPKDKTPPAEATPKKKNAGPRLK